ncbi:hypothetical protein [Gordonia alkanivorans]|uniref:hypothetical protein n=1 Tax=Gordonia alkanivorans TaxID=84096 RepID=UPI0024477BE4|nr:hypothetical protein [Gordonia alkanivorans]MDH3045346.1 hypothetical protein [Gordonia alkanivorans]
MTARVCSVKACGVGVYARGWCRRHYARNWRNGHPTAVPVRRVRAPHEDLTGRRFSDLVAESWDQERQRWRCRCDCGGTRLVRGYRLTAGAVRSCGHHHAGRPRTGPDARG